METQPLDFGQSQNCFCFNARKAARNITRLYDETLAPAGVTATQFSLLSVLASASPVSMNDFSELTATDRTTLTRNLNLMIDLNFVERRKGEDRRQRLVAITPIGRERLKEAKPYWRRAQKTLAGALGGKNAQALLTALQSAQT